MSDNVFDIGIGTGVDQSGADKGLKDVEKKLKDSAKKQTKAIRDANKQNAQSFKDFAKSAAQELLGVDQLLSAMAGGPAAMGKAVVDMGKKAVAALNEMAEKWRGQEKLEIALQKAAQNNPYINDRSVRQLKEFANEMQKITGIDSGLVLQSETKLAGLGRNQEQIQKIIKTATDLAATGIMGYDEAIMELNGSLNGVVRTSGRLYPELKELSKEALASGKAIDIIAGKVSGAATEAMKTGAGSVTAYENAVGDLKKIIGEDWENATRGFRDGLTNFINQVVELKKQTKEYKEIIDSLEKDPSNAPASLKLEEGKLNFLEREMADLQALLKLEEAAGTLDSLSAEITKERIAALIIELDKQKKLAEAIRERITIEEGIASLQARATAAAEGDTTIEILEKENRVLNIQLTIRELLKRGQVEGARSLMEEARVAAEAAEAAAKEHRELLEKAEIARNAREENRKALEAEIEMIKTEAKIRGENINSEKVQRKIVEARTGAYKKLISEIGSAGEEERRVLAELQAEYLRLEIESANRLQETNLSNLEKQKTEILLKAEIEGRTTENMQTQNEILDAEIQAYNNQLKILRDIIDGTREEETERRSALETSWKQYAQEVQTRQVQKERLNEMISKQEELNRKVNEYYESALRDTDTARHEENMGRYSYLMAAAKNAKQRLDLEIGADQQIFNERMRLVEEALDKELEETKTAANKATEKRARAFSDYFNNRISKDRLDEIEAETEKILEQQRIIEKSIDIRRLNAAKKELSEMADTISGPNARKRIRALYDFEIAEIERLKRARKEEIESGIANFAELDDTISDNREDINREIINMEAELGSQITAMRRERKEALKKIDAEILQDALTHMQKYVDAAGQLANSISTVWHNSIDYQLNEDLRKNDKIIQSDEEKAAKEKEIMIKSADEKYKADMFAWSANVTLATAAAAMAVLKAYSENAGNAVLAGVMAGLAATVGAMQVAAIISARPKRPRFHTGGIAQGAPGQEVPAILRAGEPVLTQDQFGNVMKAFANVANSRYGGGGTNLVVNVKNNAANMVSTQQSISPEGLEIVVTQIVKKNLGNGGLDDGLAQQRSRAGGINITS